MLTKLKPIALRLTLVLLGLPLWAGCHGTATPRVVSFTASPAWGDAPLSTDLVVRVSGGEGPASCALDLDGDGAPDQEIADCLGEHHVPHTFVTTGRHRPGLIVSGDAGVTDVSTEVFANTIDFTPGVIVLARDPAFREALLQGDRLELHYDGDPPAMPDGSLLWGDFRTAYLRRVRGTLQRGPGLVVLDTAPARFEEAVHRCFLGAVFPRDPQAPGTGQLSHALFGLGKNERSELSDAHLNQTFEIEAQKFKDPKGDPILEIKDLSLTVDLQLRRFVLDVDYPVFPLPGPPLVREFIFEMDSTATALQKLYLFPNHVAQDIDLSPALPIGVLGPIVFTVKPILKLEATLGPTATVSLGLTASGSGSIEYELGGLPSANGSFTSLGPAFAWELPTLGGPVQVFDGKVGITPHIAALVADLVGPYFEPTPYITGQAEVELSPGLNFCASANWGVEGTLGAEADLRVWKLDVSTQIFNVPRPLYPKTCRGLSDPGAADAGVPLDMAPTHDLAAVPPDLAAVPPDLTTSRPDLTTSRPDLVTPDLRSLDMGPSCPSNLCQDHGQGSGSFCNGSDVVHCKTASGCYQVDGAPMTCSAPPRTVCSGGACTCPDIACFTGLTATVSMGQVTLKWTPCAAASAWAISRACPFGAGCPIWDTFPLVETASGLDSSYLDTHPTPGMHCNYGITPVDACGKPRTGCAATAGADIP